MVRVLTVVSLMVRVLTEVLFVNSLVSVLTEAEGVKDFSVFWEVF